MPLRWDPLLVRHLARELDGHLAGDRVRALRLDGAARRLVLFLRSATLEWDLHPSRGAPLLRPAAEPAATDLPLPARIRRVHAPDDERVVVLELLPGRGRGPRDVVVELLGNQWNALVVEQPSGTLRHVLVRRDGPRPIRVGLPYAPPPPSPREGAREPVGLERWLELLEPVPPPQRPRALVAAVAWTSPLNAGALLDAPGEPRRGLEEGYHLWRRMAFGDAPASPVLLELERGPQPYPWALPGVPAHPRDSLLSALREVADAPASAETGAAPPEDLLRRLEALVDARLRRATSLEAELAGLEDEASLRGQGDLLLARFAEVPAGATRVTLVGFDGAPVTLELDPKLPVQENARALYDRAARTERARGRLPDLVDEARKSADAAETLLARARRGDVGAPELEEALPPTGAGPTPRDGAPSLPYRTFRSSGGLEIRVGRGARWNDDLTFRHSAPGDVWLHARHTAGAHVVLRWGKEGNPPARDLEEAAVLAALHSRARTSGAVPVDWTLRKHVRKPRGAAPGSVAPDRVKTLLVRPDPEVAERLRVE